ncbi:unnamed protein product [Phytomonas sp. Hart1]|nr:unnamed protein product [Phytomonas sp. Hart1]|eukprot:CCW67647.1 unnamed protein product [Phytomonas sp. isolate Hart1]
MSSDEMPKDEGLSQEEEQYCNVFIPTIEHSLRVLLPNGVETTVGTFRLLALEAAHRASSSTSTLSTSNTAPRRGDDIRLIFRGRELRHEQDGERLCGFNIQSGSCLHGMLTHRMALGVEENTLGARARRGVESAIASAVGAMLNRNPPSSDAAPHEEVHTESEGIRGGGGALTSSPPRNDLLHALHEERMRVRRDAEAPASGADGREGRRGSGREGAPPAEDAALHHFPDDPGRVQVENLAGQPTTMPSDDDEAAGFRTFFRHSQNVISLSLISGFLFGPVALFLPFERFERGSVIVGMLLNAFFFVVIVASIDFFSQISSAKQKYLSKILNEC